MYSLTDDGAAFATEVSLSALGHKERADLQQWILRDPTLVEPGLFVLTEEYAASTTYDGASVRDRLDLLALGRSVIVELKRDDAPSDVPLQAITYAAMASRFTVADLIRIHVAFRTAQGNPTDASDVEKELNDHVDDELSEELLKSPRMILVARSFPPQVTASAVWLNAMGLDVKLVQIRVWKTGEQIVLTSSVVYPVPGAEEFIVEPDRQRTEGAKEVAVQRKRARKAVHRIIESGAVAPGDVIRVSERTELAKDVREDMMAWLRVDAQRAEAVWVADESRPLRWRFDGQQYSPTALVREIVRQATGTAPGSVAGPRWWVDADGRDLTELAGDVT